MSTQKPRLMTLLLGITAVLALSVAAQANMKQIKAYKEAFPETKPKCINCHDVELPKKDDGMHENNAYGKAVVAEFKKKQAAAAAAAAADAAPDAETYKAVGKIEDFKK